MEENHVAQVATYLNFDRNTEEAFEFYKSVFRTEYMGPIVRHGDVPVPEGQEGPKEEDKNLIINVGLPILGGHLIMGTDAGDFMGHTLVKGNNTFICLMPDTRSESDRIFAELSAGGAVETPLQEMFWGDYYANWTDKFGVQWMINCSSKD
jgi:PhnB protein